MALLRKPLLALTSLVAALALAEAGARLHSRFQGEPYSSSVTRQDLLDMVQAMNGVIPGAGDDAKDQQNQGPLRTPHALHPYVGYDSLIGFELYENAALRLGANKDTSQFCLAVFGGSVAAIFCDHERGGLPSLLEGISALPEVREREVFHQRYARPGFKQPQQAMQLAYLLSRGARPDFVLNLDGLNEVRAGQTNAGRGMATSWPSSGHWTSVMPKGDLPREAYEPYVDLRIIARATEARVAQVLGWGLHRSCLLGRFALAHGRRQRGRWEAAQDRFVEAARAATEERAHSPFGVATPPEDSRAQSVLIWEESSRLMHHLCKANGIPYLHVLQPTLHDEGAKLISASERRAGFGDTGFDLRVSQAYPLLRESLARLRAEGVHAYDASRLFAEVEDTLYTDPVHFNAKGNALLGAYMLEALAEVLAAHTTGR